VKDDLQDDASAALVEALTQMARAFQSVTAHIGVMSYLLRALLYERVRGAPDPIQALAEFRQMALTQIAEHFSAEDHKNEAVRNEALEVAQALFERVLEQLRETEASGDFDLPNSGNGTVH
jgi:F420-0:gamma-glutamyl ligase-like protein